MSLITASNFQCYFKGVATNQAISESPFSNEFNHSENNVIGFYCTDAFITWLSEMWDVWLSESIPYSSPEDGFKYGETFNEFLSSKDVEFKEIESNSNKMVVQIRYKGRADYYYEITIDKVYVL